MMSKTITVKLKNLIPRKNITWNNDQLEMKDEIISNYDIKKGIISVSKDLDVIDGNHRYCILLAHFGGDHEIQVKQRPFGKRYYQVLTFFIVLVTFPIILLVTIFRKITHGRTST
jgi:uncharacterized glyoxalase superfamily protein PhnB